MWRPVTYKILLTNCTAGRWKIIGRRPHCSHKVGNRGKKSPCSSDNRANTNPVFGCMRTARCFLSQIGNIMSANTLLSLVHMLRVAMLLFLSAL